MGVYIKGMEMPQNCEECDVKAVCKNYWKLIREQLTRPSWCPLVSIPSHGDLIDRDALEQDAQKRLLICNKNDDHFQKPYEVIRAIALAPTIIPADESKEEMK